MSIFLGVRPGGRNRFAVSALYCTGRLPGRLILSKSCTGVEEVLIQVLGVAGEWGELTAGAVEAPLSWSGSPTGRRDADDLIHKKVPAWAPSTWFRSPNATPGSVAIQGPALTWALAYEVKNGDMPKHEMYETHPRASLALCMRDLKEAVVGYRDPKTTAKDKHAHIARIVARLVDAGAVAPEIALPATAPELDAMVAAITVMGATMPDTGLVTHRFVGGGIRPLGNRSIIILDGLA